jgi:hypothetical protein
MKNNTTRVLSYLGLIIIFILSIIYRASFEAQLGAGIPNYIDSNSATNITLQKFENFAVLPDLSLDNEENKKLDMDTYVEKIINDENMQIVAFTNISDDKYKQIDIGSRAVILNLNNIECGIVNISDFQLIIDNKKEMCTEYNQIDKKTENIKDQIIYQTVQSSQKIKIDEAKNKINFKYQKESNFNETDLLKDIIVKENDRIKKTRTDFVANKTRIESNGLGKIDASKLDEIYQVLKIKINTSSKKAQFEKETFAYISKNEEKMLEFQE